MMTYLLGLTRSVGNDPRDNERVTAEQEGEKVVTAERDGLLLRAEYGGDGLGVEHGTSCDSLNVSLGSRAETGVTHEDHEEHEDRRLESPCLGDVAAYEDGDGLQSAERHSEEGRTGSSAMHEPWESSNSHELVETEIADKGRAEDTGDRGAQVGKHGDTEPEVRLGVDENLECLVPLPLARSGTGLVGAETLDSHDLLLLGEESGGLDVVTETDPDDGCGNDGE
jgi:hypothetical protein